MQRLRCEGDAMTKRKVDPNACTPTGLWRLDGYRFTECLLSENANGTIDDAVAAARKMLADDERESAECQESPQINRVALYEHFVGGSGGWGHTGAGEVTRREVRLRDEFLAKSAVKTWARMPPYVAPKETAP